MSELAPVADVDVLKALDWEPELTCETIRRADNSVCGQPASWITRCRYCGKSWPICDEHRAAWLRLAESNRYKRFRCARCMSVRSPLGALVEFIPIGKK